jgi:class 3 adenylate cyclase
MEKINPFTLMYPAKTQKMIREKMLKQIIPVYIISMRICSVLFIAIFAIDQLLINNTLSEIRMPFEILTISIFCPIAIIGEKIGRIFKATIWDDLIVVGIAVVFLGIYLTIFKSLDASNNLIPYGITIICFFILALLPYYFYFKMVVGAVYGSLIVYICHTNGFFPDTQISDLARQIFVIYFFHLTIGYLLEYFMLNQVGTALALDLETEKVDQLLLNVLPASIADRLKSGEENIVDKADNVTIIFADLVGFTKMAANMDSHQIVKILNDIFSRFDLSAEMCGVEKIKTMGDNYFAVSGIPDQCDDHAARIARLALEFRTALDNYSTLMGVDLELRIGINTGPVVAGIIGTKKFLYDLWGDTVNLASRMESHGEPCKIQITKATKDALGNGFLFSEPKQIEVKGKGLVETYYLLGEA